MKQFFSKKLKHFDILGNAYQPTFQGNSKHSSLTGGCISVGVLIVTFSIIAIYIHEYFDYTSPEVVETTIKSKTFPVFDLYAKGFSPLIHIRKGGEPLHIDVIPRYITIAASLNSLVFNPVTEKIEQKVIQIPVKPCSLLENVSLMRNYTLDERTRPFVDKYSYCMDITDEFKDEFYIENSVLDVPFRNFGLMVMPCSL